MNFHEVRFPAALSAGSSGGPERRTEIVTLSNGFEERNSPWAHSRRRYDAGLGVRSLDDLAEVVLDVVGSGSPVLLMVGLFVLTGVLGLVISNTATVLIVLPVALAAAAETGVSVRPILMLVAVAGSAALLTPVQTPGNMMIMAPAGYRFGDYCRLGLPLLVVWLLVSLLVIPLAWPFHP